MGYQFRVPAQLTYLQVPNVLQKFTYIICVCKIWAGYLLKRGYLIIDLVILFLETKPAVQFKGLGMRECMRKGYAGEAVAQLFLQPSHKIQHYAAAKLLSCFLGDLRDRILTSPRNVKETCYFSSCIWKTLCSIMSV